MFLNKNESDKFILMELFLNKAKLTPFKIINTEQKSAYTSIVKNYTITCQRLNELEDNEELNEPYVSITTRKDKFKLYLSILEGDDKLFEKRNYFFCGWGTVIIKYKDDKQIIKNIIKRILYKIGNAFTTNNRKSLNYIDALEKLKRLEINDQYREEETRI